jgi:hypothetical protein
MNPDYPATNITINTNEKLMIVESHEYINSYYSPELRQQVVKIDLTDHRKFLKTNIKIRNPITGQQ